MGKKFLDNKINHKISLSLFAARTKQNSLNHGAVKIDPQRPIINYFALISRRNIHPLEHLPTVPSLLKNPALPPLLQRAQNNKNHRAPCVSPISRRARVFERGEKFSHLARKYTHTRARTIDRNRFDEERSRRRNEAITISAWRIHPMPISANRGELEREAKRSSRVGETKSVRVPFAEPFPLMATDARRPPWRKRCTHTPIPVPCN